MIDGIRFREAVEGDIPLLTALSRELIQADMQLNPHLRADTAEGAFVQSTLRTAVSAAGFCVIAFDTESMSHEVQPGGYLAGTLTEKKTLRFTYPRHVK